MLETITRRADLVDFSQKNFIKEYLKFSQPNFGERRHKVSLPVIVNAHLKNRYSGPFAV